MSCKRLCARKERLRNSEQALFAFFPKAFLWLYCYFILSCRCTAETFLSRAPVFHLFSLSVCRQFLSLATQGSMIMYQFFLLFLLCIQRIIFYHVKSFFTIDLTRTPFFLSHFFRHFCLLRESFFHLSPKPHLITRHRIYTEPCRCRIISHSVMLIVYLFDCLTRQ